MEEEVAPPCAEQGCAKQAHFIALVLQGGGMDQVDLCVEHFSKRLPRVCKIGEYVGHPDKNTVDLVAARSELASDFTPFMDRAFSFRTFGNDGSLQREGFVRYGGMIFSSDKTPDGEVVCEALVSVRKVEVSHVCESDNPRFVGIRVARCDNQVFVGIRDMIADHVEEIPLDIYELRESHAKSVMKMLVDDWSIPGGLGDES
jgi:hypothetical protein